MVPQVVLGIVLALLPLDNLKNDLLRAQLVGTWRAVAIEEEDGKVTKVDKPGYKFVITHSTMSIAVGREVILAATY